MCVNDIWAPTTPLLQPINYQLFIYASSWKLNLTLHFLRFFFTYLHLPVCITQAYTRLILHSQKQNLFHQVSKRIYNILSLKKKKALNNFVGLLHFTLLWALRRRRSQLFSDFTQALAEQRKMRLQTKRNLIQTVLNVQNIRIFDGTCFYTRTISKL